MENNNVKLHPQFLSGFMDGEACFGLNIIQKRTFHTKKVFGGRTEGNGKYIITAKSSSHIMSMYAQKKTSNSKNLKQNTDLDSCQPASFGSLLIPPCLARGGGIKVKTVDDNPTLLSKHFPPAINSSFMSPFGKKQVSIRRHFPVATQE